MNIDKNLLDMLVCPVSGCPLRYEESSAELISSAAGVAFPVRDGIPIMVVEEARRIMVDES